MSGVTQLHSWPSALNCLVWSQDSEIAVAAGENVEILIPNLEAHKDVDKEASPHLAQWHDIRIQTNIFTETELPTKQPAPFRTFSTGEEISLSTAAALEWSPPGLVKHRRCALGVLTSNLVLSIWVSESNPRIAASWRRVLIVNSELERYFKDLQSTEGKDSEYEQVERLRLRRRVRAFSWSPSTSDSGPSTTVGSPLNWGTYLLAVSNDNNEIVILRITSPYDPLSPTKEWLVKAIGHFQVLGNSSSQVQTPGTFDEYVQQQRFISHLAWSPWSGGGSGRHQSILAYASNSELRARNIFGYTQRNGQLSISISESETIYQAVNLKYAGPLRWGPQVDGRDRIFLVAFSQTDALCFSVLETDASNFEMSTHDLDGRWDAISGVAFKVLPSKDVLVYFASLLSTARAPTACLRLPLGESSAIPSPSWQAQILEGQALFSAAHDLGGNAVAKTWGLASSPLGDLIATCVSLHPSDMIEYSTANEQKSNVALSSLSDTDGKFALLIGSTVDVSAETVLFSVKRWFSHNSETAEIASKSKENILKEIFHSFGIDDSSPNLTSQIGEDENFSLFKSLKRGVYFPTKTLRDRYDVLVSAICFPGVPTEVQHIMITLRVAKEVLKLPNRLCDNSRLSKEILATYSILVSKLHELAGHDAAEPSDILDGEVEECDICGSPIKVESLDWARCAEGHQFARCGLSFLAIQAPGISKSCGICRKQFLKDEFIAEEDDIELNGAASAIGTNDTSTLDASGSTVTADTTTEGPSLVKQGESANGHYAPMTLARLLFSACDVCIYCGGKFIS
ncbi:hypothetical protein AOQ84DRAFT_288628 [Glonium stellatum]|uniref:Transcription factor IIIC 90kDa subunit N-terminal domain-containing protein n=1 Tax=Glonium stellatum TaxID=574774 RepID=A0A8E2F5M4_9PEZI|nr:hypothetical protein AOQ84DRAFT_288628 [Glonium stellatum]